MGTLGCINDMMRRDKENRELRKAGKERLNETRNRLIDLNKKGYLFLPFQSCWQTMTIRFL